MKVAEYVANFIASISPRVYGVCGAGAMHLNDAIANHPGITVISMQHEQAAAMAAEADARVTGNIGVVCVTAGPGGTNAMTGVACAYVDSIPMLVIAGQVTTNTMINHGERQIGMNELPMKELMGPVTKFSATVIKPNSIRTVLEYAVRQATTGRKGPVFIEIPLDVQAAEIDDDMVGVDMAPPEYNSRESNAYARSIHDELGKAKRPLIIVGNGVRLAGAVQEFNLIFTRLGIPVVSSWGAADIMPTDQKYYIGRCGIFGDRASNLAVQSADLIIAIGTRLSVAQTGHATHLFAKDAKVIVVDIDETELRRSTGGWYISIKADAKDILRAMWPWASILRIESAWTKHCIELKSKYPPQWQQPSTGINSYGFVEALSDHLEDDAVVVTDVGFCFIPTFQTMKLRDRQRLIHSAGVSPMGWGIPAAIGVAFASDKKRQIVCLTGDGGAMMNLQELQTISHHRLPIAIFVYENDGYATMKIAQNNHFKREVMSGPRSGLSLPDFTKIAKAFGIVTREFNSLNMLAHSLENILDTAAQGPVMIVMHMDPHEVIAPRVQAKTENGKFVPTDIADMWPYLPREEFASNMNPENNGVNSDVVKRFERL